MPKGLPAGALIDVTYSYSVDGRLQVTGKDRTSGKEAKVEIVRATGMDDKEIKDAKKEVVGIEVG